jgi:hypothetical protein
MISKYTYFKKVTHNKHGFQVKKLPVWKEAFEFIRYVFKRTDYIGIFGLFFRLAQNINFGSINSCLLVNDLFKVNTKQGNNIKLDSIPKASVMAIKSTNNGTTKI